MLDVLVVAPHPDDAELGMGGAILKFQAERLAVGVLDLTDGEPTPHGSPEIRRRETAEATKILGLGWRENLGLPNRSLEPTLGAGYDEGNCVGPIGIGKGRRRSPSLIRAAALAAISACGQSQTQVPEAPQGNPVADGHRDYTHIRNRRR